MSLILDGTAGVTFNNSTVQASAGVVLQVVQGSSTSEFATTSTSFVSTSISASITPKFATSKILALCSMATVEADGTSWAEMALYRGSTNIAATGRLANQGAGSTSTPSINYLDSPATTSSTTYTLYLKSSAGANVIVNYGGTNRITTITLMEIAG